VRNLFRGLRNVWRNRVRTSVVLAILGLAFCLALVMLAVESGVSSQIAKMEATVGTLLEVRPAGTFGMMSVSDSLLPADMVEEIETIDGVIGVAPYVMARSTSSITTGSSSGDPGGFPFDGRARRMVFGVAPGKELTVMGGGTVEVTSGRGLEPGDEGQYVAVVGSAVAESEGLSVGGILLLEDYPVEVIGIYDSDVRLASMGVFMPYDTVQAVFGIDGLTQIYVTAESIGRVEEVRSEVVARWGDTVDVVAQGERYLSFLQDSLSGLTSTSKIGLLLSLVAAGVVVFGTMFLAVRERSREIGILKAIGAGRSDLVLQFGAEAVTLSLAGAFIGLALFALLGSGLASAVVGASSPQAAGPALGGGAAGMEGFIRGAQGFRGGVAGMGLVVGTVDVAITWGLAGFAALGGIVLGLVGGLIPSLVAANLKPAEVIRGE